MRGEQQFHVHAARGTHTRGIGVHLDTVADDRVAGGDQLFTALHLANANAACTDLIEFFKIAERGDVNADRLCRGENRGSLGCLYGLTVNDQLYHLCTLPPFNAAQP